MGHFLIPGNNINIWFENMVYVLSVCTVQTNATFTTLQRLQPHSKYSHGYLYAATSEHQKTEMKWSWYYGMC